MLAASNDSECRKYLATKETAHKLIELALNSCAENTAGKTEECHVCEALKILYNLASFDRRRCYIPGETAAVSQRRKEFAAWGGLVAIYYIDCVSVLPSVKTLLESLKLKEMEVSDLNLTLDSLKDHLSKKAANEESAFPEYLLILLNRALAKNELEPFIKAIEEEIKQKLKDNAKKSTKVMEQGKLAKAQKEDELRQKEEEEKQRREKAEQAFQECVAKAERRKKEKLEQARREQGERESRLQEKRARRKSLVMELKRRERERRAKKLLELQKVAERERHLSEAAEKKSKEHVEKKQKAFDEWLRKKNEQLKFTTESKKVSF